MLQNCPFEFSICDIFVHTKRLFFSPTPDLMPKKETVVHMLSAALQSPVTDLQVPQSKWRNAVSTKPDFVVKNLRE